MINYSDLPDKRPMDLKVGKYYAVITNVELRESQRTFNKYLNLTYTLIDEYGNNLGFMYDIFTESKKELSLFKLKKFIDALNIEIENDFDIEFLLDKVRYKALIVETKMVKNSEVPRLEVNVFKGDVFYNISKAQEIFNKEVPEEVIKLMNDKQNEYIFDKSSEHTLNFDQDDMPF